MFFLSACAFAQTTTSTTTTRDTPIGPVGVGSTETIQISVANLASNSSSGTAASCTGSISFNNATGTAIGTATSFTVTSGQIQSVALPFSKIAASGTRAEVIAIISTTNTTGSSAAPCDLRYSLETFDTSTGASHIFLTNAGAVGGGPAGFGGPQGGR